MLNHGILGGFLFILNFIPGILLASPDAKIMSSSSSILQQDLENKSSRESKTSAKLKTDELVSITNSLEESDTSILELDDLEEEVEDRFEEIS